jgi:hypothetical protein
MKYSMNRKKNFLLIFGIAFVGSVLFSAPSHADRFKWVLNFEGMNVFSSPAIGPDSTIYVVSEDQILYAVSPNSTVKWDFQLVGEIISGMRTPPSVGADGTIYLFGSNFYAINPDGTLKWVYNPTWMSLSGAIGADGTIYLADASGLNAIKPDGTVKWTSLRSGTPAVGSDGTIYLARHEEVIAINPDGSMKWVFNDGSVSNFVPPPGPSIGTDGTIYVSYGSYGGVDVSKFYALNPNGTVKWTYSSETLCEGLGPCAIGPDGTIYFGSGDCNCGRLHALNPDGSLKWELEMEGGDEPRCPAIASDGTIYVTWGSKLLAVNSEGTIITDVYNFSNEWYSLGGSPVIAEDGTIYILTQQGNLYALNSNSPGLASCSWPMYMHDARHTASVQTDVGNPPVANAGPDQTVEDGEDYMASITLDGSGSSDSDEDPLSYIWTWNGDSATGVSPTILLPLGTTTITLVVNDGTANSEPDNVTITVIDTTPPEMSVSVSPDTLWPPNHKMVLITPTITASDNCDPYPTIELELITMNEGDGSNTYDPNYDSIVGDGDTDNDIQVDENGNIYLRAERLGTSSGRIYTIIYVAVDASGRRTTATATVTVPHNQ